MKRFGSVLVFKRGVTKKQAEAALKKIQDVLADDYWIKDFDIKTGHGEKAKFIVNEFDDKWGGPVWYLP